jgi:chaperone required for assembly of F1-ATPase
VKRVYKTVAVAPRDGGHAVTLDGRGAKTPGRKPLALPNAALADAVAAEWDAQADDIVPETMPMTRLATTALDNVAPRRADVIDEIVGFGGSDLVCYRADAPATLAARQHDVWQPLIDGLAARHGVHLSVTEGVIPIVQPPEAISALRDVVAGHDDMALAALHTLSTVLGSLVIALAVADDILDVDTAWAASRIDEDHQAERWGDDAEAAEVRRKRHADVVAAARFLEFARDC